MNDFYDTSGIWKALTVRLAFLHVGSLYGPERLLEQLQQECVRRSLDFTEGSVLSGVAESSEEPSLLVLGGFEDLLELDESRKCEALGNLRAEANRVLEANPTLRILLLSKVPKLRLIGCPGSQLIIDSTACFVEVDEVRLATQCAADYGYEYDAARRTVIVCNGAPTLVAMSLRDRGHSATREEAFAHLEELSRKWYLEAFSEIGPDVVASLDHFLVEMDREELHYTDVDGLTVEALRGAGLATMKEGGRQVRLFGERTPLRPAQDAALREFVDSTTQMPSTYTDVVADLWVIERKLRWEIRQCLESRHEMNWRRQLARDGDLAARLMERAKVEAFPHAEELDDLPNPLEWMTLSELLGLTTHADGVRAFGVSASHWTRLRSELGPVRDRVAHMRLLREGDARAARKWRHEVERLAGATG